MIMKWPGTAEVLFKCCISHYVRSSGDVAFGNGFCNIQQPMIALQTYYELPPGYKIADKPGNARKPWKDYAREVYEVDEQAFDEFLRIGRFQDRDY